LATLGVRLKVLFSPVRAWTSELNAPARFTVIRIRLKP
jgi:hypothetical protein